ncbi:hypothetical protein [Flammeovirga sp. SJP92]|uniref:hypothetical protein n=1 Tax=Flammeovirga sp. SJP92 TaxID=1775430 RepID=UPI00079323FF|nr:hypothetical protein [Flammeovirga sp. SJP92]KXX69063.1 hypothetical protein AVL50_18075 [Flammeovirga sp. SJP92]
MKNYLIHITLIFILLSCTHTPISYLITEKEKELIGYYEINDSIVFHITDSDIINYLDISQTDFFTSPYTPEFNNWENYLIKKEDLNVHELHLFGSFNDYKIDPAYLMNYQPKTNSWQLTLPKKQILPTSGDFTFIANQKYLATPNHFNSLNTHVPVFVDERLRRMYIVWLMYIMEAKEQMGYVTSKDSITFVFAPEEYSLSNNNSGVQETYDPDLIGKVQVAGSFNAWSEYFEMKKVGEFYYYSMPIDENINNWGEFKFIVNDHNWVNPPFEARNKLGHYKGMRHYNFTYQTNYKEETVGYSVQKDSVVFQWKLSDNDLLTYFQRSEARQFKIRNMYLFADFLEKENGKKIVMDEVVDRHYRIAFDKSIFKKGKHYSFNFFVNGLLEVTPSYSASNLSRTELWDEIQTVRYDLMLPE